MYPPPDVVLGFARIGPWAHRHASVDRTLSTNCYSKIQGYLFARDIKIYTGICLGDVPFIRRVNK